jgi:ribonuclease Z
MAAKIKLTFLGTADSIPSARRNHLAMLLNYNEENILIDCGEGTQRQFRKAHLNPCKVTRILITHWHGDHILGLPGLLSTLSLTGYNKILYIYGPKGTKKAVKEMLEVFPFQKNYDLKVEDISNGKFFEGKDFYLEAKSGYHGIPSLAYSFVKKGELRIDKKRLNKSKLPVGPLLSKIKKGENVKYEGKIYKAKDLTYQDKNIKVSFILDTSYNKSLSSFVKGADILVSECTYATELNDQAKEHMHLTSEQAGKIAKLAKVGRLVLTHISSRYEPNMKLILNEAKKEFKNSEIVKDLDFVVI